MRLGYDRAQGQVKELNMEAWRRTRLEMFTSASPYLKNKNLSVYDFFPLPGDPSAEELRLMQEREAKRMKDEMQSVMDDLLKKGYLTQNITVQA